MSNGIAPRVPAVGWPTWVGVVCEDLERQRAFYRDVLGLSEVGAGDDWVWFDMGWPKLFELLALDPSRPQYDERRFQVGFATADIHGARSDLLARGAQPITEIDGGPESHQQWCYFRDAAGLIFELVQSVGPGWPSMGTRPEQIVGWPVFVSAVVDDVQTERRFVRDAFELPELGAAEGWVGFDMGWPNLLEVERLEPPYDRTGYHVSFGVGDIGAARAELIRRGAEAVTDIMGGPASGGLWCYYRDAESNVFATTQRLGPPWPAA